MQEEISKAANLIYNVADKGKIHVVGHYDADGIAAASIMTQALLRLNAEFVVTIEKRLTEQLINRLNEEKPKLVIFVDLGSGYLELVEKLKTKVIVLDHHKPSKVWSNIIHVNPMLQKKELSGAGVTYLLAEELDKSNIDLLDLAVVGAIGDLQIDKGLNKDLLKKAVDLGMVRKEKGLRVFGRVSRPIHKALMFSVDPYIPGITGSESGAVQFLSELGIKLKNGDKWRSLSDLSEEEKKKLISAVILERLRNGEKNPEDVFGDVLVLDRPDELSDAREFATVLNAAGRMEEWDLGIEICLNSRIDKMRQVLKDYSQRIGAALEWVKKNKDKFESGKHVSYIMSGDEIGENFIGTIVSVLIKNSAKPIIVGLANAEDGIKVSARRRDFPIELNKVMEKAAKKVGGESGGHKEAAGAMIPKGHEKTFIKVLDEIIESSIDLS